MIMENFKHVAYNTATGEVLMTTTGNALKRRVKETNAWAIRYGYPVGKWQFAHNGEVPQAKRV